MNLESTNEILAQTFSNSFTRFLESFISFIPSFIFGVLIVLIGWLIGGLVGKVGMQFVRIFKITPLLRNVGVDHFVEKAGFVFKPGVFVGKFLQWIIVVIALMGAFDLVGLSKVNTFLGRIIGYIPSLLVVVVILVIASTVAEILRKMVVQSAMAARVEFAGVLGSAVKWSVLVLAILASLFELGIAPTFIQTLFTGLVAAATLALGLSFGIGGYPHAQEFIGTLKKQFQKQNNPHHYEPLEKKKESVVDDVNEIDEDDLKRSLQKESDFEKGSRV